ncbi:hypothetical protein CC80DRAFT_24586 [Byssothecium circinans]|uniref:C2H2-type domain-containing protein n=1 Tax=Byssothecium circinans TaxID=147558 RepID=A0A6A5TBJ5_9PLEO|nr:hypothetical protein CC80DRAFT_24586 [Byssothecium circinans]
MLTLHAAWQNFLPITNSLKLSWERHGVEDIGWSQSITRNSLIIDSLRRHASAIDGVDLHRRTSSYPSPSPEGHDCGLSYGLLPTLPMVPLPAPQIWHSPQQGTTPTLSSGRSSTASVQQQRPRSTTLGSETSTTSKRSQKPTPCAFCKRLFSNSTNAHKHMRNAAKCRRRPKPPEKFPCDVCGTMVGQYYAKDHCELNRRSQNKG